MANIGAYFCNVVSARAAGSKDPVSGAQYGGTYIPEHIDKNGVVQRAKWSGNAYINHPDYIDSNGVAREGGSEIIRVVARNGRNALPGQGRADMFAKLISLGKEFSCSFDINTYMKRLFIENVPQVDHNGKEITISATDHLVKDGLIFGNDSEAVIRNEIKNWRGAATFDARPQFWDMPGTADNETWKEVVRQRKAHVYNGGTVYGYARVIIPEGARLIVPGSGNSPSGPVLLDQTQQQHMPTQQQPQMQPAQPQMQPQMQPAQPQMQPAQPQMQPQMQPAQPQMQMQMPQQQQQTPVTSNPATMQGHFQESMPAQQNPTMPQSGTMTTQAGALVPGATPM